MNKFRIEPSGYLRHEKTFEFITSIENGPSNIHVKCNALLDDYSNGCAEFLIKNLDVNRWTCDYAKISWNWNSAYGFIMCDRSFCPVSFDRNFRGGIANATLEELCKQKLQIMITEAFEKMENSNNNIEFLKLVYKNKL